MNYLTQINEEMYLKKPPTYDPFISANISQMKANQYNSGLQSIKHMISLCFTIIRQKLLI